MGMKHVIDCGRVTGTCLLSFAVDAACDLGWADSQPILGLKFDHLWLRSAWLSGRVFFFERHRPFSGGRLGNQAPAHKPWPDHADREPQSSNHPHLRK